LFALKGKRKCEDMKTISDEELKKIIEDHQHYLKKDVPNWESMKADFTDMDLSGKDLSGQDLTEATFNRTRLADADLTNSNLSRTVINNVYADGAKLNGVTMDHTMIFDSAFRNADLTDATISNGSKIGKSAFTNADFTNANISATKIIKDNFSGSKFIHATIRDIEEIEEKDRTEISDSKFKKADLTNTKINGVEISDTNFTGAKHINTAEFTGSTIAGAIVDKATDNEILSKINREDAGFNYSKHYTVKDVITKTLNTNPIYQTVRKHAQNFVNTAITYGKHVYDRLASMVKGMGKAISHVPIHARLAVAHINKFGTSVDRFKNEIMAKINNAERGLLSKTANKMKEYLDGEASRYAEYANAYDEKKGNNTIRGNNLDKKIESLQSQLKDNKEEPTPDVPDGSDRDEEDYGLEL
jgi:uncharacterized protein YjbI with pentapeptide repeats